MNSQLHSNGNKILSLNYLSSLCFECLKRESNEYQLVQRFSRRIYIIYDIKKSIRKAISTSLSVLGHDPNELENTGIANPGIIIIIIIIDYIEMCQKGR